MPEKGLLIVISGPSGSGKGTVLRELFKMRRGLFYSVSATTRSPRPGEVNGRDYFFMSKEEFEHMIASGGMLEYAAYCGNYYGTPREAVEKMRRGGSDVILEIEVQGAMKVKKACPDAVMIFIAPPSEAELERRLRGRGTEDEATVKKRLAAAMSEIGRAGEYDYLVINRQIKDAAEKINAIITAEKLNTSRINGGIFNAQIFCK